MKETAYISQMTLELYHLDAASVKEQRMIEAALASDRELRLRYEALEESDRELRRRYSLESETAVVPEKGLLRRGVPQRGRLLSKRPVWGIGAAALLLCLFSSLYLLKKPSIIEWSDIPLEPGRARGEVKTELSLSVVIPARTRLLFDQDQLKEGDTVEMEYSARPGDNYGVIFSINGNSKVTLHYPYTRQESPNLTVGRQIVLEQPYPLDNAPNFEIFYFVVSPNPLNTEMILKTAENLVAGARARDPLTVVTKITSAFEGCEVQSITIRK